MSWIVALVAGKSGVFSLKQVSGFLVVEGLDVPLDQGEVFAVVLGVAAGALLARSGREIVGCVQPLMGRKPRCDLGVTLQTLKSSLPSKLVTARAVCGSVERLVGPGKRSGRNLGEHGWRGYKNKEEEQRVQAHTRNVPGGRQFLPGFSRDSTKLYPEFGLAAHHVPRVIAATLYSLNDRSLFVCDRTH